MALGFGGDDPGAVTTIGVSAPVVVLMMNERRLLVLPPSVASSTLMPGTAFTASMVPVVESNPPITWRVSVPLPLMVKRSMPPPPVTTYRNCPVPSMVSPRATESVAVVEIGVRHPVVVLMANPETLPGWFAVKTNVPAGLMEIYNGCEPVVATGQASAVRVPVVALMEKPVTCAFWNDDL